MPIERAKMHLRAFCGPEVSCQLIMEDLRNRTALTLSIHAVPQPNYVYAHDNERAGP